MKTQRLLTLAVGMLACPVYSFAASETLTYTSANFTSSHVTGHFPGEVDIGSHFIARVILSSPLGANLHDADRSSEIMSVSFMTVDPSASSAARTNVLTLTPRQIRESRFLFTTSSTGEIIGWDFTASTSKRGSSTLDNAVFHSCSAESCSAGSYEGESFGRTGDWYGLVSGSSTAANGCTYDPSEGCGNPAGSGKVGWWKISAPSGEPLAWELYGAVPGGVSGQFAGAGAGAGAATGSGPGPASGAGRGSTSGSGLGAALGSGLGASPASDLGATSSSGPGSGSGPSSGPTSGSGLGAAPGSGPATLPSSGPVSGPVSDLVSAPGGGQDPGPGSGSSTDPVSGPVSAPELQLDPTDAASGLILLFGGIAVLGGRRRIREV